MGLPFNWSSQRQSTSMASNGRTNSSSWRSIFSRKGTSVSTTEAFYSHPCQNSVLLNQPHMVSYNQTSYFPQHQALRRSNSISSWAPFRKKGRIEYESTRLTASEVYHRRKTKKPMIPHLLPSRSKTIDTHRRLPISAPILQDPLDQWPDKSHAFQNADFQSPVGPEEASEAIFTLTEAPDPEARITVQYSPRDESWDRINRRTDLQDITSQGQDLGAHDQDKRNEVFARIHAEGWNQIVPKQWVEYEFSEDGSKTPTSRSLYSGDETEGSLNEEKLGPRVRTTVEPQQLSGPSSKSTSRLAKTSNPRFVFEDSDDEAKQLQTQSKLQEDQVWWESLASPLSLSSTPYHQNRECPTSCLPCPVETVSQLIGSDNDTAPRFRSSIPSEPGQTKEQSSSTESNARTRTYPSPVWPTKPDVYPQSTSRRVVDDYFNLTDTDSLCPPPLRPRHEEPNCEQRHEIKSKANREATIYKSDGGFAMSPRNVCSAPVIPDLHLDQGSSATPKTS